MDFLSAEFFTALAAIVLIDIVLAGDNAIVIALAARSLPPAVQKKAIVWGTVGAIVVRILMTLVVVWMLELPGLRLFGGLLLIPIALKLLTDEQGEGGGQEISQARDFWGAMRTIIVADALMGLDNVLGVAGAAGGSFTLVVLGLLISVPIVVWGSTLILRLVERYPAVVYIGAGALLWTSAKMMLHDPLLHSVIGGNLVSRIGVFALVVGGGLALGWRLEQRKRERAREQGDDQVY
jgi:YjbE family integral membrane protein